jgi:carbon starvation protein CstA
MFVILIGILALLLGYLVYSRFLQGAFSPLREDTPATSMEDGIDYVPMKRSKNLLIQFLNIAGTGPIFGALMGAKWGPIVFLWIILGTIFGGAVHDYMTGMMSMRNKGSSVTILITKYLGKWTRYPILILVIFLMIMVSATFARSASDLLVTITGLPVFLWMALILLYFIASTVLPIDKLIGKIYPFFGLLLIIMATVIICSLWFEGYDFPGFALENLHPSGADFYPDMFITVACGAISGFHATQSPMIARCTTREKDGRLIFYGAMALESVIALIWAIAGLTFYGDTAGLTDALSAGGSAGVVYDISINIAGPVGGVLAVIGVIICPITSGDTALRSARLMIQDDGQMASRNWKVSMNLTIFLSIFIVALCMLDFSVLWQYFSWLNQTLACIVLWTATVFLLRTSSNRLYSLVTALPALFMTMTVTSFILHSGQGLSLDYSVSLIIAAFVTVAAAVFYIRAFIKVPQDEREGSEPCSDE